jgi:hypothetical protein
LLSQRGCVGIDTDDPAASDRRGAARQGQRVRKLVPAPDVEPLPAALRCLQRGREEELR